MATAAGVVAISHCAVTAGREAASGKSSGLRSKALTAPHRGAGSRRGGAPRPASTLSLWLVGTMRSRLHGARAANGCCRAPASRCWRAGRAVFLRAGLRPGQGIGLGARRHEVGQLDAVVLGPDVAQPVPDIAAQHERISGGVAVRLLVGDEGEETT